MITKMKKLTFLVYHKEYDTFLNDLRDLGVVHVAEKQQGTIDDVELQEKFRLSGRLTATLNQFEGINSAAKQKPSTESGTAERGVQVLDDVEHLQNEKNRLNQRLQSLLKDKSALEPWGDFSSENISKLQESGIEVGFYVCQDRLYKEEWAEQYNAIVVSRISSKVHFITLTKSGEDVDLDVEKVRLPAYSLTETAGQIKETEEALLENEQSLTKLAADEVGSLKAAIEHLRSDIEFSKVLLNTEHTVEEKIKMLQGWVPASKEAEVTKFLQSQNVYFEILNPTPDDDVPILLKNKGLFAWFEPICKLYMLPKYSELDLTPFFAPFFMIFFGLCLGDIGYGMFLLVGASLYRLLAKNIGASMKPILSLVQVLAFSTMVCGLLTGGFFGFSLYELDWPIAQKMRDLAFFDNSQMFQLSLLLGVVQILLGMILKAVNQFIQFGFKYAIATIGWVLLFISIIVAMVIPAVMPMGGTVHLIVLGVAAAMIFLFNSPGKNVLVNIGLGVWDTYNMATGLLGDVLSYVRLFALGLSGGILASVFNSLAIGLKPDNVILGPVVFLLIFLIGHAINIFMNVLGAIVHPMRLTFVEFFKNSGYEGGGKEYTPFKKQ